MLSVTLDMNNLCQRDAMFSLFFSNEDTSACGFHLLKWSLCVCFTLSKTTIFFYKLNDYFTLAHCNILL